MKNQKLIIKIVLFFTIACLHFSIHAQNNTHENLKEINKVWAKFYKAFNKLEYSYMAEIHSKNLVRVSGGKRILGYTEYINNYKKGFEVSKKSNQTSTISLRFFERINSKNKASERGIYKLTRDKDTDQEKSYYGKFHVIFIKENNTWKILMDYDSNENNAIGEKQFQNAFAINDFSNF